MLADRKKICTYAAFLLKVTESFQKRKERILQYLFRIQIARNSSLNIPPKLRCVFMVKRVYRFPVVGKQSLDEGTVVHEIAFDYSIIDGLPQIPYTEYVIEHVFALQSVALQQLAPNPGISTYGQIVNAVVRNAFVFASLISFFLLLFGGFQVIVAAGDAKKAEQGKAAITGAVIGLLVVFGSFWIVQALGVLTGQHLLGI